MATDDIPSRWTNILLNIMGAPRYIYQPESPGSIRGPGQHAGVLDGARNTTINNSTFYLCPPPGSPSDMGSEGSQPTPTTPRGASHSGESGSPHTRPTESDGPHSPGRSAESEEHISRAVDDLIQMTRNASLCPADHRTSAEIYGFFLQRKNLGHPLWKPEPEQSLSRDYSDSGIMVGDVGIITVERGFHFLFNILYPRTHPRNSSMSLPPGFSPLSESPESYPRSKFEEQDALHWWYLADNSMARTDEGDDEHKTVLETSAKEAAALMLPEPVHGESFTRIRALQGYMKRHIESWYRFAHNVLELDVQNGDIRLVHAYRKTSGYGIATVSKGGDLPTTEVTFLIDNVAPETARCKYMWRHKGYAQVKAGPNVSSADETVAAVNQCLFIKTVDFRLQSDVWNNLILGGMPILSPDGSALNHPDFPRRGSSSTGGGPADASSPRSNPGNIQSRAPSVEAISSGQESRSILPSDVLVRVLLSGVPSAAYATVSAENWGPYLTDDTLDVLQFVETVMKRHAIIQVEDTLYLMPAEISSLDMVDDLVRCAMPNPHSPPAAARRLQSPRPFPSPLSPTITLPPSPISDYMELNPEPEGESHASQGKLSVDEQGILFHDAFKLPLDDAGPFLPQSMFGLLANSEHQPPAEEVLLEQPLYFVNESRNNQCGILLKDAMESCTSQLLNHNQVVLEGSGPSVLIHIGWPGHRPWSRQISTKDTRSPPQPITLAKLAKNVAKCVARFMQERKGQPMEEGPMDHPDDWRFGDGPNDIKLDDLVLVSIHHVSSGTWQPHLRLARPRSLSRSVSKKPYRSLLTPTVSPAAPPPPGSVALSRRAPVTLNVNSPQE